MAVETRASKAREKKVKEAAVQSAKAARKGHRGAEAEEKGKAKRGALPAEIAARSGFYEAKEKARKNKK